MIEIRNLSDVHIPDIVALHVTHLPGSFHGKPGGELLKLYYKTLVVSEGGCGFVAVLDGCVVGYVCGVWAQEVVKRGLVRRFWGSLLFWGGLMLVYDPKLGVDLIKRLFTKKTQSSLSEPGYELRPIVVSPLVRGKGVADGLVNALIADARSRKVDAIHLFTEESNLTARRFYKKQKFIETHVFRVGEVKYHRFEMRIAE